MGAAEDNNLRRLKETTLAAEFVEKNRGEWDHRAWMEFCQTVESHGFFPIDLDQVGLHLEAKKSDYFGRIKK